MFKKNTILLWMLLPVLWFSCSEDETYIPVDEPEVSPVVFNIANVPYQTLSEYNFFEGSMSNQDPVYGVLPYEPINKLFSDYAKKRRFVWMPSDVKASYVNDDLPLNFPLGTVLIKTFYYDNVLPEQNTKLLETRLMIKKQEGWVFANYVWNNEQNEATLDLNGSFVDVEWIQDGQTKSVNYRIPAEAECRTCHKSLDTNVSIGTKPRNLNKNYNYSDGLQNQLSKLVNFNYLEDNLPANITSVVSWEDTSQSLTDRTRGYVDINCAHCHIDDGHCSYRPIRLNYEQSADPINMGVCVEPDTDLGGGLTHIVSAGNSVRSVMSFRMESTDASVRMPLIGRTIVHDEGVELINAWINSLTQICE